MLSFSPIQSPAVLLNWPRDCRLLFNINPRTVLTHYLAVPEHLHMGAINFSTLCFCQSWNRTASQIELHRMPGYKWLSCGSETRGASQGRSACGCCLTSRPLLERHVSNHTNALASAVFCRGTSLFAMPTIMLP